MKQLLTIHKGKNFGITLEFKVQDCWVGVFWEERPRTPLGGDLIQHLWICLVPMLPIHVKWRKEWK